MEKQPEQLPERGRLQELRFKRLQRVGLLIKEIIFGQFSSQWPPTRAAEQHNDADQKPGSDYHSQQITTISDSIIAGL